ncbi:MAG TPA: hypothetical protein DDW52_11705 [Planctomycetaceae bacterium]|nr:hypothetical protein [Planctomycetaceae bacterium]
MQAEFRRISTRSLFSNPLLNWLTWYATVVFHGDRCHRCCFDLFFSDEVPSHKKWPPISDDEFIQRCSPGVDRDRALKVRRIISEQLGLDYDRIYPEQRFVEDLGCD